LTPRATEVFSQIYDTHRWRGGGGESRSGSGSSLRATALIRPQLSKLFSDLDIRLLCDAPCGDSNWIVTITDGLDLYFGFDVVEDLIIDNLRRIRRANHFFRIADIIETILPKADAILCRDCLVHLPLECGLKTVSNLKASGSTFLIATTFVERSENPQSKMGNWRPLNLQRAPFDFPPPLRLLRERPENPSNQYNDKMLGVWRLADINIKGLD
jgi:hypothetical protein